MAKFTLEWRQLRGSGDSLFFIHRLAYTSSAQVAATYAKQVGDQAWRREFRIVRGDQDVFTDLHRIEDWSVTSNSLPQPSDDHIWRQDLEKDLAADRFMHSVTGSTPPAIAAGVLRSVDADTLVRFARSAVQRPRL